MQPFRGQTHKTREKPNPRAPLALTSPESKQLWSRLRSSRRPPVASRVDHLPSKPRKRLSPGACPAPTLARLTLPQFMHQKMIAVPTTNPEIVTCESQGRPAKSIGMRDTGRPGSRLYGFDAHEGFSPPRVPIDVFSGLVPTVQDLPKGRATHHAPMGDGPESIGSTSLLRQATRQSLRESAKRGAS